VRVSASGEITLLEIATHLDRAKHRQGDKTSSENQADFAEV
jgi:hypothetical protein